jgi:hypothetical protein
VSDGDSGSGCPTLFPYHPALDHGVITMAKSHGGVVVKTTGSLARVMDSAEAELNERVQKALQRMRTTGSAASEKSNHRKSEAIAK